MTFKSEILKEVYILKIDCVPNEAEIKWKVLEEAHKSKHSIHPGENKMYQDLKRKFRWNGMKRNVAEYVAACLTCQRMKAEHKKSAGLLTAIIYPWMEMGLYYDELCHWVAAGKRLLGQHLDHSWSFDKSSTVYCYQHNVLLGKASPALCGGDCKISRSTRGYCIRRRSEIYFEILA